MSFEGSAQYAADVETAFKFFCDPESITARFQAAGDRDIEILRCEADGDGFVIESRRVVEVDLPSYAAKVLPDKNTVTQTDRWSGADSDGTRRATYVVDVSGAPLKTDGSHVLEADGDGSKHTVSGSIEVKIPIIGKKIGKFAAGTAQKQLATDFAFNTDRLS